MAKKIRSKSKAAQATAERRATRQGQSWEDHVAEMDHPETAGFVSRLPDDAPSHAPVDAATLRRRSWIGGLATAVFALAALGLLVWMATRRG